MDAWLVASLVVLGAATGFLAGLLGIGGGMIMVPFLTLIFTARDFPEQHIVHGDCTSLGRFCLLRFHRCVRIISGAQFCGPSPGSWRLEFWWVH